MKLNYYRWPLDNTDTPPSNQIALKRIKPYGDSDAQGYVPHPELVEAVNVALALGMPLLLTGEPGTGKTTFAASVAFQLRCKPPLKFVAKSNSIARDLFYGYDALGRLYAAEIGRIAESAARDRGGADVVPDETRRAEEPLNFIEYSALGRAILLAHPRDKIKPFIETRGGGARLDHPGEALRSVVLIDEIDKAPRDFTNDLLDELETMQFRIPELGDKSTPVLESAMRPVVIITSNSERQLPDAFMRRCLYFHIPFPGRRDDGKGKDGGDLADPHAYTIENIVAERLGDDDETFATSPLVSQALDFFYRLRAVEPRLRKPPATAELLNWLVAMCADGADPTKPLRGQADYATRSIAALLKTQDDFTTGRGEFDKWLAAGSSH